MLTTPPTRPVATNSGPEGARTTVLRFSDNILLQRLLGDHDRHLSRLEQGFDVKLSCRGNKIAIAGESEAVSRAQAAIIALYNQIEQGGNIDSSQIDGVIRLTALPARRPRPPAENQLPADMFEPRKSPERQPGSPKPDAVAGRGLNGLPEIRTKRGVIAPRSHGQAAYMEMLAKTEMVFGIGPAGTGKTYLAVAQAVSMLLAGQVDRIVLSRPAVEAGERLGFLPGDMREKIDPYLRPLYDALHDMMPGDQVVRRMGTGEIEVAPLAFMRGRTLAHAYVILDEAQNTTQAQMKMFLTRMGQGTRMAITGDLSQVDLPRGVTSGLREAVETLDGIKGIGITRFASEDVVRHPLVGRIVDAYEQKAPAGRDFSRDRPRREDNGTAKSTRRY
ncbi:PhoH family protein [Gluconobacter wancherniae]|uniref:PhoH-like protein n=1 Tax=Gluconobacter wancherniae NBRC 103581 TaxID=656744 RepID=A0A511B091_9PROT|nr:PhoH family protein [Gluconobacter wancherniae]MBF0853055.1 PhoH family protein [Gluconobacter wancherniae]MBS1061600.1 PhoH family protein [Gluconobacter wancherniae]MBS1093635.1 PhoH family protein [Gluconobacter wancherniae]GBD56228.1 phosphate starvation protein PhoH [Gluconobacter wancherniae NBRC 103581]GBR63444.1 phosphate starvation-inducible protein PhoH [Gluconobacter wancherniae NBRC 103581]